MEIRPSNPLLSTSALSRVTPLLASWKVGEIIEATVAARLSQEKLLLKINDVVVPARGNPPASTDEQLTPGATLKLEIVSVGKRPTLKVLNERPSATPQADAIRTQLPRQAPLTPLLANIVAFAQIAKERPNAFPQPLTDLVKQVLNNLPTPKTIEGGPGIKEALRTIGLFLENNVQQQQANRPISLERDIKGNLLRLLRELNGSRGENTAPLPNRSRELTTPTLLSAPTTAPGGNAITQVTKPLATPPLPTGANPTTYGLATPPPFKSTPAHPQPRVPPTLNTSSPLEMVVNNLIEQVEGALSRLRLTQLGHLPTDQSQGTSWLMELPIRRENGVDLIQLRLDQESTHGDRPKGNGWVVTLAFSFEELGPVYARISLVGKRVNAALNAERASTTKLISEHLSTLTSSFVQSGLEVGKVHCRQGKPSVQPSTSITKAILDTKA